jgi:hypothetical protein
MIAEARREDDDCGSQHQDADPEHDAERRQIAERGTRRPPQQAVDLRHQRDQRRGFEEHHA